MLRLIALLIAIGCMPAMAGLLSPPLFEPMTAPDGARTWRITMDKGDVRKEDRALSPADRDAKISSSFMGWKQFCSGPWEITSSREEGKKLVIEGRCK